MPSTFDPGEYFAVQNAIGRRGAAHLYYQQQRRCACAHNQGRIRGKTIMICGTCGKEIGI